MREIETFSYSYSEWKHRDSTNPKIHGNLSNSRLDWTDNTEMLLQKDQRSLNFPRRLSETFYQSSRLENKMIVQLESVTNESPSKRSL